MDTGISMGRSDMKRLKRWIWIPIVIVVAVGGYVGYGYYQTRQYAAMLSSLQTQVVETGTITASVSATGTLAAVRTADLSFGTTGEVGQVNVKLGQTVKQGQVLASLDPASLPSGVNLAKQDLVSAQQALANAQSSLTAEANAEVTLADAQIAFTSAQTNYNTYVLNYAPAALSAVQKDLQIALAHYRASPTKTNRTLYMQALQNYQAAYQQDVTSGTITAVDPSTIAQITAEYNLAKAELADAQAALKNFENGVNPQTVAAAQAQVAADEATIAEAEITAPFDGTISALNVLVGNEATSGTVVISMADVSQLHVDIPVSELDISTIQVGESATLNFDAFPSKNYQGQVTAVSTDPAISSGSVTYAVRVVVGDADPSLLPGMTAGVTIVTSSLSNVLVVPSRAVRTVGTRQVVYVVKNGGVAAVTVELGSSNDTESAVTGGGLKAGDRVVTNPTAVSTTQAPSILPFGLGGIGGIGGGPGGGAPPQGAPGGGPNG